MGDKFEALESEVRDAVNWMARRHMEDFAQRHPDLATVALAPSMIEAVQEDIAKRDNLEDVVARHRLGLTHLRGTAEPR